MSGNRDSRWETVANMVTESRLVALSTVLLVGGLVGAVSGGFASSDDGYEPLVVTDACEDETNVLTIENPNDEAVDLTVEFDHEEGGLSVQSETYSIELQTTSRTVNGEQTTETSLGTTIPAEEGVSFVGLSDGDYNLSATIDDTDVDVEDVPLECGASEPAATVRLTPTEDTPVDEG